MKINLPLMPCVVRTATTSLAGFLYIQGPHSVVLLTNLASDAELGELKPFRDAHVDPEASITVIPCDQVLEITEHRALDAGRE